MGKTSYELYRLKALDKTTGVVSTFGLSSVVILVFFMFVALVTIGIAVWIGDLLGKTYY